MGGGVVRALRMARSDAAEGAGWRDLTGKLVFPGPVVLCRSGMPLAGRGGCPATTVGVPVASLAAPAAPPGHAEPDADAALAGAAYAADAVPIPLLRGLEPELEVLPEAVFGQGCAAFAVDDRILTEPGWGRRPGAGDRPLRGDPGGAERRCARHGAQRRRAAVAARRRPGGAGPRRCGRHAGRAGDGAAQRRAGQRVSRWRRWRTCCSPSRWRPRSGGPAVRSGTVRMVSLGAEEGAADRQFLARLWRAGVAPEHITLEELAALLCWQPARLLGLPGKERLHPGCDADLAVLDPEAPAPRDEQEGAQPGAAEGTADGTESDGAAWCGGVGAAWRGGCRRQAGPLDPRHPGARAAVTPRDLPASFWTTVVIEAAGTADSLGFADSASVSLEAGDCETGAPARA